MVTTKGWYHDRPHPDVCCICHEPLAGRKVHREIRMTRLMADFLGPEVWRYDLACWRDHIKVTQCTVDKTALVEALVSSGDDRCHVFPRRMTRGAI